MYMQRLLSSFLFISIVFGGVAFAIQAQSRTPERVPLKNPIARQDEPQGAGNIVEFIDARLSALLSTMFGLLGVISLLPVVIGGIQLILSRGTASMAEKGKKTLYWGLVGLITGLLGVIVFNFLLTALVGSS